MVSRDTSEQATSCRAKACGACAEPHSELIEPSPSSHYHAQHLPNSMTEDCVESAALSSPSRLEYEIRLRLLEQAQKETKDTLRSVLDRLAIVEHDAEHKSICCHQSRLSGPSSSPELSFVRNGQQSEEEENRLVPHVSPDTSICTTSISHRLNKRKHDDNPQDKVDMTTTIDQIRSIHAQKRIRESSDDDVERGPKCSSNVVSSTCAESSAVHALPAEQRLMVAATTPLNVEYQDALRRTLRTFVRALIRLQVKRDDAAVELDKVLAILQTSRPDYLSDLKASSEAQFLGKIQGKLHVNVETHASTGKMTVRLLDVACPYSVMPLSPVDDAKTSAVEQSDTQPFHKLSRKDKDQPLHRPSRRDEESATYNTIGKGASSLISQRVIVPPYDIHFLIHILERYGYARTPSSHARYLLLSDLGPLIGGEDRRTMQRHGRSSLLAFVQKCSNIANVWVTDHPAGKFAWLTDTRAPFRHRQDSEKYWRRYPRHATVNNSTQSLPPRPQTYDDRFSVTSPAPSYTFTTPSSAVSGAEVRPTSGSDDEKEEGSYTPPPAEMSTKECERRGCSSVTRQIKTE